MVLNGQIHGIIQVFMNFDFLISNILAVIEGYVQIL